MNAFLALMLEATEAGALPAEDAQGIADHMGPLPSARRLGAALADFRYSMPRPDEDLEKRRQALVLRVREGGAQ